MGNGDVSVTAEVESETDDFVSRKKFFVHQVAHQKYCASRPSVGVGAGAGFGWGKSIWMQGDDVFLWGCDEIQNFFDSLR